MADIELVVISTATMTEVTTTPDANDLVIIQIAGPPAQTCVIRWVNLWSLLSGGRAFGGNNAGDVVTTNGIQTMSGKRLDSPRINGTVTLSASSVDLNKIFDLQEVVREDFLALMGAGGAQTIAARLGALRVDVDTINDYIDGDLFNGLQDINSSLETVPMVYASEVGIGAGITTHTINEATLVSGLGLPIGTKLHWAPMVAFGENVGSYLNHSANTGAKIYRQTTGGVVHLDRIEFTVVAEKLYWFNIAVKRIAG